MKSKTNILSKNKSFFVLIFFVNSILFTQTNENIIISCQPVSLDSVSTLHFYNDLILKLKNENKIDNKDAFIIKMLSSSGYVAFEQTSDSIVIEKGKIEETDIKYICKVKENENNYYLIVTQCLGFFHSFKYYKSNGELYRVKNNEPLILARSETIRYKNYNDTSIIFISLDKYYNQGDHQKYFIYDTKSETFFFKKINNQK